MRNSAYRGEAAPSPVISLALQQALQSWDGFLDRLPIGIYACDRGGIVVQYNRRAAELWGRSLGEGRQRYCGSYKAYRAGGAPLPPSEAPMAQVLRTGLPMRDREIVIERPDGSRATILANVDPLFDGAGEIVGGVNCFQDITELKRSQEALREREQWYRGLLEALPAAVYTTDAGGRITFYNQAAVELAGRLPTLGSQWCVTWRLHWPDGTPLPHEECPMAVALKEQRPVRGVEAVAERPDGTRVPFIPYPTPLYDGAGAMVGAVNMLVDISERKHAEQRQKALLDELNHRVKNTLATVQSLAAQTIRGAGVPHDVREAFEARLLALSRAHDHLTREQWGSADLKSLADEIFAPYSDGAGDRVRLEGGSVKLAPRAALMLAMVLHELATNAAKYGALSTVKGALAVSWTVVESGGHRLCIDWRESGGPPVQEPKSRGFGTRLVERGISGELKGSAEIAFAPGGVHCRLEIPLPVNGS